jgi:hypothetical protein
VSRRRRPRSRTRRSIVVWAPAMGARQPHRAQMWFCAVEIPPRRRACGIGDNRRDWSSLRKPAVVRASGAKIVDPMSKELDKVGRESDEDELLGPHAGRGLPRGQARVRQALYSRSLD